jgi:hypothetical protein
LAVNGTVLGTWSDNHLIGKTYTGILANPYSGYPTSDARFDNFSINSLQITRASELEAGDNMKFESGSKKVVGKNLNWPDPDNPRSPLP